MLTAKISLTKVNCEFKNYLNYLKKNVFYVNTKINCHLISVDTFSDIACCMYGIFKILLKFLNVLGVSNLIRSERWKISYDFFQQSSTNVAGTLNRICHSLEISSSLSYFSKKQESDEVHLNLYIPFS